LLILAGHLGIGRAGEYLVKTWDAEGLPESAVTDVAQSAEGYIWAGTLNRGLSRFDGVRFVNFDSDNTPQLAARGVRRLIAGPDGTMWINGFGNYLASWRAGGFHLEYPGPAVVMYLVVSQPERVVFSTQEGQLLEGTGPETNRVWKKFAPQGSGLNPHFFADEKGGVWFRRTDHRLIRLWEGREIVTFPLGTNSPTTALAGDAKGRIAIGVGQRLMVWQNGEFQDCTPANTEANLPIQGLVSDGQDGWWVEANRRLRRCRDRKWVTEAADWNAQRRSWGRVRHEQPDGKGGLWFAYVDGGLVHVSESGEWSALTSQDGLPGNTVRDLYLDREENLWVSFERSGLARVRRRRFEAVGHGEGLVDNVTTSVCEDPSGAIWIGTMGGTVARYAQHRCTNFTLPLFGTHCEKSLIYPDPDGRVWIAAHGNGVSVYENGEFRQVLTITNVGIRIRALLKAHDGQIWVASQDGLFCYSNELRRLTVATNDEDYPTSLAEDVQGNVWAGMNTGELLKYEHGSLSRFRPPDLAMRRRFSAITTDDSGAVWIGTLGAGLLRFENGQFKRISTSEGLPTESISQILADTYGKFWFGSSAGIFSVRKSSLDACAWGATNMISCHLYGRDDGLPTLGCAVEFQPTSWRARDGRLWFAMANGVTCIQSSDSQDLDIHSQPPPAIIEELRVDGKLRTPEGSKTGYIATSGQPLGHTPRLVIEPGRHQLEFRYTGLSLAAPDRIRFKYALGGLDKSSVEPTSERVARYNSVPPGEYRFRLAACNGDGVWSTGEASLVLVIQPHAWETWWFRTAALSGLLLAVGAGVWGVERRRTRQRLAVLEREQVIERERARVARDLHDDLGAGLTEIGLLGALAKRSNAPQERVQDHLGHITNKAREMVTSLDEIVWSLNPKYDSLSSLSRYFCEYAQQFLQLAPIRCRLEVDEKLPACALTSEQRHHLLMAFKEVLTNVIKHANASEVRIGISAADGTLTITVSDDGQGVPAGAPAEGAEGFANISRRMEQLGGTCQVASSPGNGTTVRLSMSLAKMSAP
jgi:signal transduction histidine kinase/ligand-binding sensor domain-containing protein